MYWSFFSSHYSKCRQYLQTFQEDGIIYQLSSLPLAASCLCIEPFSLEDKNCMGWLLQGDDHICSSALSPCGGWLAYSTVSGVRLYRLQYNNISITKVGSSTLLRPYSLICLTVLSITYEISNLSKAWESLFYIDRHCNLTSSLLPSSVKINCVFEDFSDTSCVWRWWGPWWSSPSLSPSSPSCQVSRLPKELRSAHQLCFSSDSSRLFASSSHSSVVVVTLDQLECKYLHTLKPKSGQSESRRPTASPGRISSMQNLLPIEGNIHLFHIC